MTIEIDPDGDLLITLTPLTKPFAAWPVDDDNDTQSVASNDSPAASTTADASNTSTSDETNPSDNEDITPPPPEPVLFRVSAKHMCFASPRFKQMLTGPWLEATTIHPDGLRHVDIDGDFDASAFEIVMMVIHGSI